MIEEKFYETKITFIIPTIGRTTLKDTLLSLINQTNPHWKAIVIFDGIEIDNNIVGFYDERIKVIKSSKLGEGHNSAGNVRNYGIQFAETEWIAFVDDDDSIKNTYVDIFLNEIIKYNYIDLIIFRMLDHGLILPPDNVNNFEHCRVGISFALKKYIFDSGIVFEPSTYEDFFLLNKIRENNFTIMISPYLLYFVKKCDTSIELPNSNRVFINADDK
jgi:glycosyltransferase involved in cell wall biosynthesis